jgi:RNA polymerase sigma factor (sigma-70 family)
MATLHRDGRRRPARREIEAAAMDLIRRRGPEILATARRYAATPDDAEDAYQRGFEILLRKTPTTSNSELVPWLKTVVKHEAFALRRQSERHAPVTYDGQLGERPTPPEITHDQAERYERLRHGAEAVRLLKPHEARGLRLRAEGYSYKEICLITGWSYTKVNRCLTEGRQALAVRLAGIQGGIECAKLAPHLSALADGEASAEDLALLRPHMKTCLACRARLREFRAAPARVAAVVPPAALVAAEPDGGSLRRLLESLVGAAQHKAAAFGERAQTAAELVSA